VRALLCSVDDNVEVNTYSGSGLSDLALPAAPGTLHDDDGKYTTLWLAVHDETSLIFNVSTDHVLRFILSH